MYRLVSFPSVCFIPLISYSSVFFNMVGYIGTSINDGPGCLTLRCPDPTCAAAVGQDMIDLLASDEDKHKYGRYLLRSYIEDSKKVCTRCGLLMFIMIVKGNVYFFLYCQSKSM